MKTAGNLPNYNYPKLLLDLLTHPFDTQTFDGYSVVAFVAFINNNQIRYQKCVHKVSNSILSSFVRKLGAPVSELPLIPFLLVPPIVPARPMRHDFVNCAGVEGFAEEGKDVPSPRLVGRFQAQIQSDSSEPLSLDPSIQVGSSEYSILFVR